MASLEVKRFKYNSQGGKYGGIYASCTPQPQKGIVLFHGHSPRTNKQSGYRDGVEVHLKRLVTEIAEHQPTWAVAAIDCRGYGSSWAPEQQFNWLDEDAQQAASDGVRTFMDQFGLREEQLFLWGQSEGGQMAMLLAAKYLQDIGGVISFSGVLDHAEWVKTTKESETVKTSHEQQNIGPEKYYLRSPLTYVGQIRCPVLVWYSHEDKNVIPDIPISFARALNLTNPKVVVMSFEGGHSAKRDLWVESDRSYGFQYGGDWMWENYFAHFIEEPDPSTFRETLDIHNPLEEAKVPNLAKVFQHSDSVLIQRAVAEALAQSIRDDKITPSQLGNYYDTCFLETILGRQDIAPERKVFILESVIEVEQGRILTPHGGFSALLRSAEGVNVLYEAAGVMCKGFKTDPDFQKALIASNKLGRFFRIEERGGQGYLRRKK